MKKGLFIVAVLVLFFGVTFTASAIDLRSAGVNLQCGDHMKIVSKGTKAVEVLMKCGEPMRKEIQKARRIEGQSTEQYDGQGQASRSGSAIELVDTYEIWFYNGGQNYNIYAVEIFNNVVLSVHVTDMPGSGLPDWERKR